MSSITGGLTVEQFCTGRDNYPEFKERFILAMEAQGLAKIILGTQIAPVNEPTLDTITYDLSGAQTGVTKKQILATGPGSSNPTKDEYQFRERRANAGLFACVINPKSYGLETAKSASENWKKLDDALGKGSMTEQIISRDELLSARFTPSHESKTEYDDYAKSFQELRQRAVAAGGEYTDSLLRITYIVSIDNEDYINAASNIAVNANLETTISFLRDTWLIRHQRKVKELGAQALVARANAVTAASVQTPSGQSNQRSAPRTPRICTSGNRGTGPCINPTHGSLSSHSAQNHNMDNCWYPGGGDVANRPPGFIIPASANAIHVAANSATIPNNSIITIPDWWSQPA
ncbi:hypothetical protein C8J56DRAFT_889563 [Mycena floridula]|nr:hypothetical protein C8J56DRAFT_889563 [Mycena floridula]